MQEVPKRASRDSEVHQGGHQEALDPLPLYQVQGAQGLHEGPEEGHQQGLQEGPQGGPVHKMRKVGQFGQDHGTTADRAAREQVVQ